MSGDIRGPEAADDDIPVLTDIVVPGRLQPAAAANLDAPTGESDFVFDIDFRSGDDGTGPTVDMPTAALTGEFPAPASGADLDLPLPWGEAEAEPDPPAELQAESAPASAAPPQLAEPPIAAAVAKAAAAAIEPPDADAQLLLRELLAEIGSGLERRIAQEMAHTEQRLRAALREELDIRLRELLAGTPPTV